MIRQEFQLRALPGEDRLVSISGAPVRDEQGRVRLAVTVVRDITERKRAEIEKAELLSRLEVALKLRDEFIAAAAHELRTPVTGLKGYAGLIRKRMDVNSTGLDQALDAFELHADRIARLARDLITAAELAQGMLSLQGERLDLAEVARAAVHAAQAEHPRHCFRLWAATAIVHADPERIGEVLHRLLDNAVRYQAGSGYIDVGVGVGGDEAVVSVRDYGAGIGPERQPFVFEPMYEPVPAGGLGYVGVVGLGLAIGKGIVGLLGGRIWVESTPGQTTTFWFSLPTAADESRQPRRE